jgi:hypothetical protein
MAKILSFATIMPKIFNLVKFGLFMCSFTHLGSLLSLKKINHLFVCAQQFNYIKLILAKLKSTWLNYTKLT